MKHFRLFAAAFLTVVALSAGAQSPSGRYIARGFYSEDAMLSAYFALPPVQRETVQVDRVKATGCYWYPFMLVYEARVGETDGRYLSTTTIKKDDGYPPLFADDAFTFVKTIKSSDVSAVVIAWTGPRFCPRPE